MHDLHECIKARTRISPHLLKCKFKSLFLQSKSRSFKWKQRTSKLPRRQLVEAGALVLYDRRTLPRWVSSSFWESRSKQESELKINHQFFQCHTLAMLEEVYFSITSEGFTTERPTHISHQQLAWKDQKIKNFCRIHTIRKTVRQRHCRTIEISNTLLDRSDAIQRTVVIEVTRRQLLSRNLLGTKDKTTMQKQCLLLQNKQINTVIYNLKLKYYIYQKEAKEHIRRQTNTESLHVL